MATTNDDSSTTGGIRGDRDRDPAPPNLAFEDGLRTVVDTLPHLVGLLAADGTLLLVNQAMARAYGANPQTMEGRPLADFIADEEATARLAAQTRRVLASGIPELVAEESLVHVERGMIAVQTLLIPVAVAVADAPQPTLLMVASDVTDRKQGVEALRHSESFLRQVVQDSPCGIAALSLDGHFLTVNTLFCEQTGVVGDAIVGTDGRRHLAPEFLDVLRDGCHALREGQPQVEIEWNHRPAGDEQFIVRHRLSLVRDDDETPLFYVVIGDDMTETYRIAEQIQGTQKLESLGLLAGGIAHEFNNLLLGIIGNADLAALELPDDHPARETLEEVSKIGFRAADLCNQLLAYSGKGKVRIERIDLSELIRSMAPLLKVSLGSARLNLDLAADLPPLDGDATQLRQVVMNLVSNAAEAMQGRSGAIELRTGCVTLTDDEIEDAVTADSLPAGEYVMLQVGDSGCGLDQAQLARIFDPFYTTKFSGRGLGLAAVLGIVRGHRGTIRVDSEVDVGTTFDLYLPVGGIAEPAPPPQGQARRSAQTSAEARHVLVVDDEAEVRDVSRRMLAAAGYEVTTAEDGYLALELFGREPDSYDLVLLDMTMPGISGTEALGRIRQFRPRIPVLLTSGFNRSEVVGLVQSDPHCAFLQKPYKTQVLQEKVAAMLA